MNRAVHHALTAIVVTFAIAALPLVMDQCAAACELARADVATSSAPSCHHTSSPVAKVGGTPRRCGHEHQMARLTAADATPAPRTLVSGLAMVSGSMTVDALSPTSRVDVRAPDVAPDLHFHASLSPLRI